MIRLSTAPYQKRFLLAALLIVALAALFWNTSRYPALDEKLLMSGAIQLEDGLSFEAAFAITADMTLLQRIWFSTLNWINTNLKGMSFGLLFAAGFLTAMPYLNRRSFDGSFANALLGLSIGTPLGVCVNCAAPIARGMYSGGMRAETVLAAMIASPTLNVVVLTMAFSLLPFYMVLAKIALSLMLILIGVPLLCHLLPRDQVAPAPQITTWSPEELAVGAKPTPEPLHQAAWMVARSFAANLYYIVKMTLPLMLLAAVLGAIAATLLPPELITSLPFGLAALGMIAAVGLFLPVPIAFDVVVCGMLMGLGLSQGYVMALLFTLGSFSIYSFFIITQAISLRAATLLSGMVLVLGITAGMGAQAYHDWQSKRALEILLGENDNIPSPGFWAAQAATLEPVVATVTSTDAAQITLTLTPLAAPSPAADNPFTRIEASQRGIDKPLEFSFADMWPPFWEGRSLSAGDIDRDGDLDLVLASTEVGLYAYENDGSGQFSRIQLPDGPLQDLPVFNAVLVDIDNDGWLDLFVATYRQGNFLVQGSAEGLDTANPQPVANRPDAVLSLALAFGDVDRDGDLDVALGNWAAGWYRRVPGEESRNRILWNDSGALSGDSYLDLPAIPGETLSLLLSDIDNNGTLDLWAGNDFEIPDAIYLGDGGGGFSQITYQDQLIPQTTTTTMAVKSADLSGDGSPEIYLAQIAGRSSGVSDTLKMQRLELYCDGIIDPDAQTTCRKNMAIKSWYKSGNNFDPSYAARCQQLGPHDQLQCKAMLIKDLAIQRRDASLCALIPATQDIAKSYCELHFRPSRAVTAAEAEASIPQILRSNVLLQRQGDAWADVAEARGLDVGGWSWDTKIEDFDLDGDLDVYIVNGTWVPNEVSPSNLYFENDGSSNFTETSGVMGLEDYLMTAAALALDIDGDGDLDILTQPVNGPVMLFVNNAQTQNRLVITLEDHIGNRDGIGAVLVLTDDLGQQQRREIQLGGGFMSFDAPRVSFGLGEGRRAEALSIRWADGAETRVMGDLQTNALYQVRRQLQ
ncbi:MAG: RNA-binding protein [Rhodobacteraceae bacterium]|nr:MAG: RNA-binding protein [Paracoccaceae bacterium]